MREKSKDALLAVGLVAVGLSALVIINVTTEQSRIVGAKALTYATMPSIYGVLLVVLAGLFLVNTLRAVWLERRAELPARAANPAAREGTDGGPAGTAGVGPGTIMIRTWGTLAVLVAYVIGLQYLSFLIVTTLFLLVMFLLFGERSVKKVSLVAACGGAGFYGLFIYVLKLPI